MIENLIGACLGVLLAALVTAGLLWLMARPKVYKLTDAQRKHLAESADELRRDIEHYARETQ